jgi:hypothetical protein
MTVPDLKKLPLGTRVVFNRKGVSQGDEGAIAELPSGSRYIQWDDGETTSENARAGILRRVKKI